MPLGSGSGSFAAEVAIIERLSTLHEKGLLLSARSVVGIGLVAIAWDGGAAHAKMGSWAPGVLGECGVESDEADPELSSGKSGKVQESVRGCARLRVVDRRGGWARCVVV